MEWFWKTTANEYEPGRDLRRLAALFPGEEATDVEAALVQLPPDTSRRLDNGPLLRPVAFFSEAVLLITWQGTQLAIPYRLYVQEPAPEVWPCLSTRQQQLLHCLYLRHYDGYVRQRHLEALLALGGELADFTTPFTFSLLGEYVQEILVVLAQHLTPALAASYVQLIRENPRYWQQTQGWVASYWDCYYRIRTRGAPRFQHYVGARLLARLQHACHQAAEQ